MAQFNLNLAGWEFCTLLQGLLVGGEREGLEFALRRAANNPVIRSRLLKVFQ